jgi:hypothetical protein
MAVQRPPEKPRLQPGHPNGDAVHALLVAAAQIGLSLQESQGAVTDLGALLARLSETLATLQASSGSRDPTERAVLGQLQGDIFKGIQQLQFYDRMVQHLTHIQRYVIEAADELGAVPAGALEPAAWEEMHARLRKRLISDEQRSLLDLFLMPDIPIRASAQAPPAEYSDPGSFEMF